MHSRKSKHDDDDNADDDDDDDDLSIYLSIHGNPSISNQSLMVTQPA